ncbi:MAG TPA: hypothetical protein PLK55_02980 [archaeon]|jgi:hypothetical protein|nr:hypothetical protein [archaeon]
MNKKYSFIVYASLLLLIGLLIKPIYAADDLDTASLKVTLLNQDPDPAEPGEYVDIRFKVEKFGNNPLTNISFVLEPEYPFLFDDSDVPERNIGTIKYASGDDWYYNLKYKLKVDSEALEGTYDLKLKYEVNNSNVKNIVEFNIAVGDATKPDFVAGNIISSPTKLVPDTDSAQLNIEISNIGDEDAQNVVAKLNLPTELIPTYSYSDRSNLATIASGTSKVAIFYLDVDKIAESKIYSVPLIITYKEKNDNTNEYKTKTINIEIPIKEKPVFKVTQIITEPVNAAPGDKVKIIINLQNTGKDAEAVSLKLYKESSQPITFDEKTDYIGTLDKGETGTGIISLEIDKDAELKDYLLDLEIRAIDGEQVIVQNETISLKVSKSNKQLSIIWMVFGIVILVSAAAGFYFYNKSKEDKKKKK